MLNDRDLTVIEEAPISWGKFSLWGRRKKTAIRLSGAGYVDIRRDPDQSMKWRITDIGRALRALRGNGNG